MEYKGKLYGKVGKSYIPLMNSTDDYDNLVNAVKIMINDSKFLELHGNSFKVNEKHFIKLEQLIK